jgi:hypothetical protein
MPQDRVDRLFNAAGAAANAFLAAASAEPSPELQAPVPCARQPVDRTARDQEVRDLLKEAVMNRIHNFCAAELGHGVPIEKAGKLYDLSKQLVDAMLREVRPDFFDVDVTGKYGSPHRLAEKLAVDEPWFAVRAQDAMAPGHVLDYVVRLLAIGDVEGASRIRSEILLPMIQWQRDNPSKVKLPD